MTKLEAEVEKTEKNEEEPKKQKMETFKKILLVVHSFTLILSFILFVCGIVTNLKHLAFHEAWHASYGMYNGSVLCITVGVIGIIISIVGKIDSKIGNETIRSNAVNCRFGGNCQRKLLYIVGFLCDFGPGCLFGSVTGH